MNENHTTTGMLHKIAKPAAKTNNGQPAQGETLPEDRQKAVEYGLAQFQTLAHERDQVRRENADLRDKCAGLQIVSEGLTSQLTEAHSQIKTAMIVRDQAMAERIKYESLFVSIQAQMRAFAVPAAPLIRDHDEETAS